MAKAKAKTTDEQFSQRGQFVSTKGARLDVHVKKTPKGFRVVVMHKKAPKSKGDKVKSDRGMVTMHATQESALKKYGELVADAVKNGWTAKQTVTKSSFTEMPKADA